MSQENVKLAHEVIDAVKTQDASRLVELTDPEVEWHSLVGVLGGSEGYRGHDGIRRYIEDIADTLEFVYAEIDDAISVGELVLLLGRFHYLGKASRVDTKSPGGFVVRFRDGRVVYMRAFRDPEQALAVVGLSEAMSRENVEVVRRVYEAVTRREAETVLALYDPNVEWDMSRGAWADLESDGIYHGHEGLRSFFRRQREVWEEWEDNPDELIDAGEHVVSVVRSRSRGRTSGVEVESHHAAVWTIRDGRITRVVWFRTRAEALEAVGMSE